MAAAPQIVDGELSLEMEQVPSSQETGERIVRGSLSLLPGAATGRGAARRSEMETWACLGLVSEASCGPMAPATRTSRQRWGRGRSKALLASVLQAAS